MATVHNHAGKIPAISSCHVLEFAQKHLVGRLVKGTYLLSKEKGNPGVKLIFADRNANFVAFVGWGETLLRMTRYSIDYSSLAIVFLFMLDSIDVISISLVGWY